MELQLRPPLELPTIRWTRDDEKNQFAFSFSIMEAILTCPVWGLVRYYNRKYYPTKRILPLEAGSQMHEVFGAVRAWQLYRKQGLYDHFVARSTQMFGTERHNAAFKSKPNDQRTELLSYAFSILNSGEYYDDPDDKIRTIANMEETTIRYADEMMPRMERDDIWVSDVYDPTGPVGIEQVLDVMVEWQGRAIRYIGTIDGIVCQKAYPGTMFVDENKTASRIDAAWRDAFKVKSQPTGYLYMAKLLTGLEGDKSRIIGVKLKQARNQEDFTAFFEPRGEHQLIDWARSLFFAADMAARYGDTPLEAPQFTHACNRYFRACAFIDLCAADPEDRVDIYNNSMVVAPLTPSQEKALASTNST